MKWKTSSYERLQTCEGWDNADAFTCATCGAMLEDREAIETHIRATAQTGRPHHAVYTAISFERTQPTVAQAELAL